MKKGWGADIGARPKLARRSRSEQLKELWVATKKKKERNGQSNSLGIPPHKVRADTKRIRLFILFFFCFGGRRIP